MESVPISYGGVVPRAAELLQRGGTRPGPGRRSCILVEALVCPCLRSAGGGPRRRCDHVVRYGYRSGIDDPTMRLVPGAGTACVVVRRDWQGRRTLTEAFERGCEL
jgi:hypothetical protein